MDINCIEYLRTIEKYMMKKMLNDNTRSYNVAHYRKVIGLGKTLQPVHASQVKVCLLIEQNISMLVS